MCQACITVCVPLLVHLQSNTAPASCFSCLGGGGKEERVCNMRQGKPIVFSFFFHGSALLSFFFMTELNKHDCLFSKKRCLIGTGYFWGTAHAVKIAWLGYFYEQSCQYMQVCTPPGIIYLDFKSHFYMLGIILIIWILFHKKSKLPIKQYISLQLINHLSSAKISSTH